MVLNLESLQGQAETRESAWAVNAFLFQLWAEAPSGEVHDFSLGDRFPLKLPALIPGRASRRAGQGRAGRHGARQASPGARLRLLPSLGCGRGAGGGRGGGGCRPGRAGTLFHVCKRRSAPSSDPRRPSSARPRRLRVAPHAHPSLLSSSPPLPPRWRSGPGAGGPHRRRRCCYCCSG